MKERAQSVITVAMWMKAIKENSRMALKLEAKNKITHR